MWYLECLDYVYLEIGSSCSLIMAILHRWHNYYHRLPWLIFNKSHIHKKISLPQIVFCYNPNLLLFLSSRNNTSHDWLETIFSLFVFFKFIWRNGLFWHLVFIHKRLGNFPVVGLKFKFMNDQMWHEAWPLVHVSLMCILLVIVEIPSNGKWMW